MATPRRSTCSPRSRNFRACALIQRPSSRRSIPLQPRLYSIASSPKVDRKRSRSRRYRALQDRQPRAARRRIDLPGRSHQVRRHAQGLCRRRTLALPADPAVPIIMIKPAPASRRSVPSCTSAWPPRRPAATGRSSPPAQLRLLLRGRACRHEGRARAHPPHTRLVARRRSEDLRAGPHARGRP